MGGCQCLCLFLLFSRLARSFFWVAFMECWGGQGWGRACKGGNVLPKAGFPEDWMWNVSEKVSGWWGEKGYCGNKENQGGKYYSLVYNKVCAAHIDPIEKKPFYHYLRATLAFSLAAAGCNFSVNFAKIGRFLRSGRKRYPTIPWPLTGL